MRLTIFGAGGGIGRHVVQAARQAGHELTLVTRDASTLEGVTVSDRVLEGDVRDAALVGRAVAGAEAVVNTLGPTSNSADQVAVMEEFTRHVIAAMQASGVRRIVTLSGGAVSVAGQRKGLGDRFASAVVRLAASNVLRAKQREYDLLAASDLEWVAVRPPRVTDETPRGSYRAGDVALGPRSRIGKADLAAFMLEQLTGDAYLRQAPYISY
ncbi:MAG TPA: NAD(P)H-binding protein [Candidatus Limnocylindria bacterium]|nr:NAD(P)H-binding protein [Candidatus Limnocylindria bacterium]